MVVAVYTTTVFAVVITAATRTRDITQDGGHLSLMSLETTPVVSDGDTLSSAVDQLVAVPGVTMIAVGRTGGGSKQDSRIIPKADKTEALGALHVESPNGAISINTCWPCENAAVSPSPVSAEELASARRHGVPVTLMGTDLTSPGVVERARTALATSDLVLGTIPTSPSSTRALQDTAMENQLTQLGYIGILIAAGISVVSLGVSAVAALLGHRWVLGLLRLVDMPAATLRSMVSHEMILSTVTALAMSIGLGQLAAWALVGGVSGYHTSWSGGGYWLAPGACLALMMVATLASAHYG